MRRTKSTWHRPIRGIFALLVLSSAASASLLSGAAVPTEPDDVGEVTDLSGTSVDSESPSPWSAAEGCDLETTVTNRFSVPINIDKIQSAAAPLFIFKTNWNGSRKIKAGESHTFKFKADLPCNAVIAWQFRFIRDNGTVHKNCGVFRPKAKVDLKKPNVCEKH